MKVKVVISTRWLRLRAPIWALALLTLTAIANPPFHDAWKIANEAREKARAGDYEEALEDYEAALALLPAMEIRRDYATTLGWAGRWQDAAREFTEAFRMYRAQPRWALQEMANAFFFAEANEQALEAFDLLIASGVELEATLTRRGLTLLRLERYAEAETQYRQALAYYPRSEVAAVGIVRSMMSQGRPEAAFAVAVTWGAESEPDSEIRAWQAHLLTVLGRYQEAVAIYDQLSPERLDHPELRASQGVAERQVRPQLSQLHQQGVQLARDGDLEAGLKNLEDALNIDPENDDLKRDYAIVLSWGERYEDALVQFDSLLASDPDQPAWARTELAHSQLFGGRTQEALETLDDLVNEGQDTLPILSKRGLALRWLGRSEEASSQYRTVIKKFPEAVEGPDGLAHSLADRNRLSDAIGAAENGLERFPKNWRLQTTLAQVLNWSGRHLRAERTLNEIPDSEEVLMHKTLAARWSSQPRKAFDLVGRYRDLNPSSPDSRKLFDTLKYEYGGALRAETEAVSDSLGYSYFGTSGTFEYALSSSQRLSFGHNRRNYQEVDQPNVVWNRYRAGWSGSLGNRLRADAGAGAIDYSNGIGRRFAADASLSALLTDKVTLAAGAGIVPAETLPALRRRLTAGNVWTSARFRPTLRLDARVRFSRLAFQDETTRQTAELSAFQTVSRKWGQRIRVGVRAQWLWHDRPTGLMWSPSMFTTQLASLHLEGRLPGNLDHVTEIGTGIQQERGFSRTSPLVATVGVAKRIRPNLWLRAKTGYSSSALGRLSPGRAAYRFRYFSAGLDYRLGIGRNRERDQ